SFRLIDFTGADLRQTVYVSADMIDCLFAETNLAKVDFSGNIFKDCVFSGLINEVLFSRSAFRGERFPPNEMKGVDLRKATFRHVEFRNLDMNDVKWPESDQHIVLSNYKGCLSRMIEALRNCADV
ncbi:MAG TPA: pentapeptide repeat-containing protein, partial [Pyrinomonadaceae bacterium]|nr:pentapeptide repeat-containing protein [Pyrinomonadaceae bacterium]